MALVTPLVLKWQGLKSAGPSPKLLTLLEQLVHRAQGITLRGAAVGASAFELGYWKKGLLWQAQDC